MKGFAKCAMSSLADPAVGVFEASSHKRQKVDHDECSERDEMGGNESEEACIQVRNTFGLEDDAALWFCKEQERAKTSYLRAGPQYIPYIATNGKIPTKHIHAAFSEFEKRFGQRTTTVKTAPKDDSQAPTVILVASGVIDEDWVPGEDIGHARFLLIPKLSPSGGSALFLTYMPGPEHGSIDGSFADDFGAWRRRYPVLQKYFVSGQSSGGYGHYQPDKRLFPKKKFRDRQGRDVDRGNKNLPYSRFNWEVEYDNRDPVELRQRGKVYMNCKYTRLFLAAKFYAPDGNGGNFEASMVLWRKTNPANDVIAVVEAVSFGTKDLSDDHKREFFAPRHDRIVGVRPEQWRRPQPVENPDDDNATTPSEWMLSVPFSGIVYKVMSERRTDGTRPYLAEELVDGQLGDLQIDLRTMLMQYSATVDLGDDDDDGIE